jgi:hypothetical protein
MSALSSSERAKLAAILGRLGSNHAGERDAAALAATRFISAKDVTWPSVLEGVGEAEALASYVVDRLRERTERRAKQEENRKDPAWRAKRFRRWALRRWDTNAIYIGYRRGLLTEEEAAWLNAVRWRTPHRGDDAIKLHKLSNTVAQRSVRP